jgi:hypothetical protein
MARQVKFRWVKAPKELGVKLDRYGEKLLVAIHAVAAYVGAQMQAEARGRAAWEDRTGNARSGLMFAVDGFGQTLVGQVSGQANGLNTDAASVSGSKDHLVLALGHTVFYGKYLELSYGGRYAIIMSTIERNLPTLERMMTGLLNKL